MHPFPSQTSLIFDGAQHVCLPSTLNEHTCIVVRNNIPQAKTIKLHKGVFFWCFFWPWDLDVINISQSLSSFFLLFLAHSGGVEADASITVFTFKSVEVTAHVVCVLSICHPQNEYRAPR